MDTANCGTCGNACSEGKSCTNGVCTSIACDSTCSQDRVCNRNGSTDCICATETGGNGVCFNKQRFKCKDGGADICTETANCKVGFVCVKDYCMCGQQTNGICVNATGCGLQGPEILGPLMRIGAMEKRRRML